MLEILTPLNKCERVSRAIDSATFVAAPGYWAVLKTDGSIENQTTSTEAKINKLVIGSASSNQYESHDIEVGRITTMESIGIRVKVDTVGYYGTINLGDRLVVSSDSSTKGKLISLEQSITAADYEVVARAEEVNTAAGYIVYRTISPIIVTKS